MLDWNSFHYFTKVDNLNTISITLILKRFTLFTHFNDGRRNHDAQQHHAGHVRDDDSHILCLLQGMM